MSARPTAYCQKVKGKPLGFQRQNANAVRARSKATYHADPQKAQAISAEWARENPESPKEYVR